MPFLPARPRRSDVIRQAGRHGKSGPVSASSSTSTLGPSSPSVLAKQALEHFNRAQDAVKVQDWARYGEELKKMRGVPSEGGRSGRPLRSGRDFQVQTLESGDPPSRTMARMWPYCPALSCTPARPRLEIAESGSGCTAVVGCIRVARLI